MQLETFIKKHIMYYYLNPYEKSVTYTVIDAQDIYFLVPLLPNSYLYLT